MPFDMIMPPGAEDCAAAWGRLRDAHDVLADKIAALPDDKVIDLIATDGTNLGSFKAQEYKFKFPRLNWSLVATVPANGGVGATESLSATMGTHYDRWTGANTRILRGGLLGYDAWGAKGLNYLALHETAHTTMLGLKMTQDCWNEHRAHEGNTPYGVDSPAWTKNERFANDIALAIAREIDVECLGIEATAGVDLQPRAMRARRAARPSATAADIPLDLLDLTGHRTRVRKRKTTKKPTKKSKKAAAKKKAAKPRATRKARSKTPSRKTRVKKKPTSGRRRR